MLDSSDNMYQWLINVDSLQKTHDLCDIDSSMLQLVSYMKRLLSIYFTFDWCYDTKRCTNDRVNTIQTSMFINFWLMILEYQQKICLFLHHTCVWRWHILEIFMGSRRCQNLVWHFKLWIQVEFIRTFNFTIRLAFVICNQMGWY